MEDHRYLFEIVVVLFYDKRFKGDQRNNCVNFN